MGSYVGYASRKEYGFLLYFSMNYILGEIETDNLTVSNSEIITFDFTVSRNRIFVK